MSEVKQFAEAFESWLLDDNNEELTRAIKNTNGFYIEYFFKTQGYDVQPTVEGKLYDYVITDKTTDEKTYLVVKVNETLNLNPIKYKQLYDCSYINETDILLVHLFPIENLITITNLNEINSNNIIEETIIYTPSERYDFDMSFYEDILEQHIQWENEPQQEIIEL